MNKSRRALLLPVACLVALAGCGSGGTKHSATSHTEASPPSTASSASRTNGEGSKSPTQIVADAAAALRSAHGYVMRGTITQNAQQVRLNLVAPDSASMELLLSVGGATTNVIVSRVGSFVRGNATFWTAHLGRQGAALANRWIQVPPANAQGLAASLGHFAPATLSRCLAEDHGTLVIAGRTTVDGQGAIVVRDAGNLPGSSPGTLAVATSGPPYPLRATSTGPSRAGGRVDVCNNGKAADIRGVLTFSHFGSVAPIRAPSNAIRPGHTAST